MSKQNLTPESAPAAVLDVVRAVGANIATARLRRRMTLEEMAAKAGISKETAARVESGRVTTSMGAYAAALWVLGLHHSLGEAGAPEADREGTTLAAARLGRRARPRREVSDDF
jgi:transcriptional regulator with XRE-family HTH domain